MRKLFVHMNIEKIQYENYYNKKLNQKIVIHIINPKIMNWNFIM